MTVGGMAIDASPVGRLQSTSTHVRRHFVFTKKTDCASATDLIEATFTAISGWRAEKAVMAMLVLKMSKSFST